MSVMRHESILPSLRKSHHGEFSRHIGSKGFFFFEQCVSDFSIFLDGFQSWFSNLCIRPN